MASKPETVHTESPKELFVFNLAGVIQKHSPLLDTIQAIQAKVKVREAGYQLPAETFELDFRTTFNAPARIVYLLEIASSLYKSENTAQEPSWPVPSADQQSLKNIRKRHGLSSTVLKELIDTYDLEKVREFLFDVGNTVAQGLVSGLNPRDMVPLLNQNGGFVPFIGRDYKSSP